MTLYEDKRTTRSQFSTSNMWMMETELSSSGLAARAFAHRVNPPAPKQFVIENCSFRKKRKSAIAPTL